MNYPDSMTIDEIAELEGYGYDDEIHTCRDCEHCVYDVEEGCYKCDCEEYDALYKDQEIEDIDKEHKCYWYNL